jgi:hypothetical protein
MTLSREEGGLGLFSLGIFLGSQVCTLAKRAQSLDDNWKLRLYKGSNGNTLNLRSKNFCKREEPILFDIAYNMESFQNLLSKVGDNYKESYIVDNDCFLYGGANRKKFDQEFFGVNFFDRHPFKLGTLKFSHLLNENYDFLEFNAFVQKSNLNISEEKFNIIRRSAMDVKEEHENLQIVKKGLTY